MRGTRPPRSRPFLLPLLVLLAGACDGGGGTEPAARPDELRLTIVRGQGMRMPVRPAGTPAGEAVLSPDPIIVQVSTQPGGSAQGVPGAVELRWRAIEPWCEPLHATTPLTRGDTVHNYYRRATLAGVCRMVVEGVSGGWVFDADTAVVRFDPDRMVRAEFQSPLPITVGDQVPIGAAVCCGRDAYGNFAIQYPVRVTITSGPFTVSDTAIHARAEGVGTATVTVDSLTQSIALWALPDLGDEGWRIRWACHDRPGPDGTHTDSMHIAMDSVIPLGGGSVSRRGVAVAFMGSARRRTWRRGEPVRTDTIHDYNVLGIMQPGQMEWSPGQVALRTTTGYAGGSLCEVPAEGPAWGRFTPVRLDRR